MVVNARVPGNRSGTILKGLYMNESRMDRRNLTGLREVRLREVRLPWVSIGMARE